MGDLRAERAEVAALSADGPEALLTAGVSASVLSADGPEVIQASQIAISVLSEPVLEVQVGALQAVVVGTGNEARVAAYAAVVVSPLPVVVASPVTVWDGSQELPATMTVWDGSQESAVTFEVGG